MSRRGCRVEEDTEISLAEEILDSRNEVDRPTIDSFVFLYASSIKENVLNSLFCTVCLQ